METLLRAANPQLEELFKHLFVRYPGEEWGTFARFGWRETRRGLVLTLVSLDFPEPGDIDERLALVRLNSDYIERTGLSSMSHQFGVGVIHSHPSGYQTYPSATDDDMDGYFSGYFDGFAPERPYVSLIFAECEGRYSATGRVFWKGSWHKVTKFSLEGITVSKGGYETDSTLTELALRRVARLGSALGKESAKLLANATVAVVGASGTGSPALEILARAGVGTLIPVDQDRFEDSNLERLHGSGFDDIATTPFKVDIAARHIRSINPDCVVIAVAGKIPQKEVVDELLWADFVVGCTDQHHARLALSDISTRFLVPVIDTGVSLEGKDGHVSGQILQLTMLRPSDPCVMCRGMVDTALVSQELMTDDERNRRRDEAGRAKAAGEDGGAYWRDTAQINTVGYLTTACAAFAAGYVIGEITGRFAPPFSRLQMNISAPSIESIDPMDVIRPECTCSKIRGWSEQGIEYSLMSAPGHWDQAEIRVPA